VNRTISIGIAAYNEEANIGKLLKRLLNQNLPNNVILKEIIVVASGCTDKTVDIVKEISLKNEKVKLITQEKREGKASAVNLFIKNAIGNILVLESADTLPEKETINRLVKPFYNPRVGMTGGRPIPINDPENFLGFVVHLIWHLHHKISLKRIKLGELIAFRNVINGIPNDTAVDEAYIEALIREKGYDIIYVPEAIVRNKGPETLCDLIKQRKRIYIGHLHLKSTLGYTTATMSSNSFDILRMILSDLKFNPKYILWTLLAISIELYVRISATIDFHILNKNPVIWDIAESTKEL
jgi:cellulose synthase/poly-beta-1,6-N-acetylglucosamine synthase-like glycosyltransferase